MLKRRKKGADAETTIINDVRTTADHAAHLEERLKAAQDAAMATEESVSTGKGKIFPGAGIACPVCGTAATGPTCPVDGYQL